MKKHRATSPGLFVFWVLTALLASLQKASSVTRPDFFDGNERPTPIKSDQTWTADDKQSLCNPFSMLCYYRSPCVRAPDDFFASVTSFEGRSFVVGINPATICLVPEPYSQPENREAALNAAVTKGIELILSYLAQNPGPLSFGNSGVSLMLIISRVTCYFPLAIDQQTIFQRVKHAIDEKAPKMRQVEWHVDNKFGSHRPPYSVSTRTDIVSETDMSGVAKRPSR